MFFVYILACLKTGRTYVGQTDDLLRRYRMHADGSPRLTSEPFDQPVIVHWEVFRTRGDAMRTEREYKSDSGGRLVRMIVSEHLPLWKVPKPARKPPRRRA